MLGVPNYFTLEAGQENLPELKKTRKNNCHLLIKFHLKILVITFYRIGLAINTVKSYESDLRAFWVGLIDIHLKKDLSDINKVIVYDYLITRLNSGINANSIKGFYLHLSFLIGI